MVIAEGKLNEQFFGSGVKFDKNFVVMANDFDMQIKESQNNAWITIRVLKVPILFNKLSPKLFSDYKCIY